MLLFVRAIPTINSASISCLNQKRSLIDVERMHVVGEGNMLAVLIVRAVTLADKRLHHMAKPTHLSGILLIEGVHCSLNPQWQRTFFHPRAMTSASK